MRHGEQHEPTDTICGQMGTPVPLKQPEHSDPPLNIGTELAKLGARYDGIDLDPVRDPSEIAGARVIDLWTEAT